jgi:hypothetical protein
MLQQFRKELDQHKKVLEEDQTRVKSAYDTVRNIASKASSVKTAQDLLNLIPASYKN